jgi:hypothetical protein
MEQATMGEQRDVNFIKSNEGSNDKKAASQDRDSNSPELDFSAFLISLSGSASYHFGELPDPSTGKKSVNLLLVKQTIDILSILQKKTKGNLTEDENRLIGNLLYELRMKFMKHVKA